MNSVELIAQVSRRWADFLGTLSADELRALADGKQRLSLIETVPGKQHEPRPVLTSRHTAASPPQPRPALSAITHPEATEIIERLRSMNTEQEGMDYLTNRSTTVALLRAVGAELGLRLPSKIRKPDALRAVLDQTIGAKRKFAGLRKW